MSYCNIHQTNHCLECAIEKQTKAIVAAIEKSAHQTQQKPERKIFAIERFFRGWNRSA